MKNILPLLLLFCLSSCAGFEKAAQKRRVTKAEQVLAAYKRDTPPAEQLADLLDRNPQLEGKTVRIVKQTDTVRIAGAVITVHVPAVSTPASDNALIDSLMRSAASQLHAKDSLAYAARLRAILAARPRLRRDTLVQVLGVLTVRTWVDAAGIPHTIIRSAPQKIAFEKVVHQTGPILVRKEMTIGERVVLFLKDAYGIIIAVLVIIGIIWVWFFIQRQRGKRPDNGPLPF